MTTERSDRESTPDDRKNKQVDPEDVRVESASSLSSLQIGRNKTNKQKQGIYLDENLKQTFAEFKRNKIYSILFFLYVCLEFGMGFELV